MIVWLSGSQPSGGVISALIRVEKARAIRRESRMATTHNRAPVAPIQIADLYLGEARGRLHLGRRPGDQGRLPGDFPGAVDDKRDRCADREAMQPSRDTCVCHQAVEDLRILRPATTAADSLGRCLRSNILPPGKNTGP